MPLLEEARLTRNCDDLRCLSYLFAVAGTVWLSRAPSG
jgi:hypothetical protein